MLRHVVLLQFLPATDPAHIEELEAALAQLPDRLAVLRDYRFGRDAGLAEGNHDFAIVAEVDDAEAYAVYRDDPEHRRIITELVRPILASRAAAQYEC